jgi:pseudaminic acid biosynthesis-associated methylase
MSNDKKMGEQEKFWKGGFGDEYIERNKLDAISSNIAFFSEIIGKTNNIKSVLEFGCNVGNNLRAIERIIPNSELYGVEINSKAVEILKNSSNVNVEECSIINYVPSRKFDLVLVKAVLIHVDQNELNSIYKNIYDCADKYIIIAEYYSPTPAPVIYRGNKNKLCKRDFAGEFMQQYPDTSLLDYGFKYHKDNVFPQDDITWFLIKKNG